MHKYAGEYTAVIVNFSYGKIMKRRSPHVQNLKLPINILLKRAKKRSVRTAIITYATAYQNFRIIIGRQFV